MIKKIITTTTLLTIAMCCQTSAMDHSYQTIKVAGKDFGYGFALGGVISTLVTLRHRPSLRNLYKFVPISSMTAGLVFAQKRYVSRLKKEENRD